LKLNLKIECSTPDHPEPISFTIAERYDGLRRQPRVMLVDDQGAAWHYDQAVVRVAATRHNRGHAAGRRDVLRDGCDA